MEALTVDGYQEAASMAKRIPLVIMYFRVDQMVEILFSGFEAELYSQEEMPFLYWYLSRTILPKQLRTLDDLSREIGSVSSTIRDGGSQTAFIP